MIDLHTHTSMSDGSLTPRELIAEAAERGIRVIAITDHDSIFGLEEGVRAAADYGVEFVPGIEITARHGSREFHFLGLFIDMSDKDLADTLESWRASRSERNSLMHRRLMDVGVELDMAHLLEAAGSTGEIAITRMHFARAIVEAGYCGSTDEAFKKYLSYGTPTFVARRVVSAAESIAAIKRAGGLPILAHPMRYGLTLAQVEDLIRELRGEGLLGLECYYSSHGPFEQAKLLQLAKNYRLCVSGGSDFHGLSHSDIQLGKGRGRLYVPYSVYEQLQHIKHRLAFVDSPG